MITMNKEKSVDYQLGVKRSIESKRGTGTRDQDTVKTTVRFESFDQLQELQSDILEDHRQAVKGARAISESGDIKYEKKD